MKEEKEVCGTCQYHRFDKRQGVFICVNDDSEYCGLDTEYKDTCENYEDRF